jgi:hypothetical protein
MLRVTATVQVNDRVAENAVEPGLGAFFISEVLSATHRFQQALLYDVCGKFRISQPLAGKSDKFIKVL